VSADQLYEKCAETVLSYGAFNPENVDHGRILLEAATVAKARAQTEPQLRRAIGYLEVILNTDVAPLRVLGMLTEFSAIIGDRERYDRFLPMAEEYRRTHEYIRDVHLLELERALERAANYMQHTRTVSR
jgi:hypothetical protein